MIIFPCAVETELLNHTTSEKSKRRLLKLEKNYGGVLIAYNTARTAMLMYSQP